MYKEDLLNVRAGQCGQCGLRMFFWGKGQVTPDLSKLWSTSRGRAGGSDCSEYDAPV
jgi:hypothetical protein